MISVEDWMQINELLAQYCWAADACDGRAYTRLWTEDGELRSVMLPERVQGHAALAKMIEANKGSGMRHMFTNLTCEYADGNPGEVRARFYNYVSLYGEVSGAVGMALCTATIVRQDSGWKLKTNDIDMEMAEIGRAAAAAAAAG